MRFYECTVVLCPELSKIQIEEVRKELEGIVETFDGSLSNHEYWGMRSLAYPVEKFTRAHYIYFNIAASGQAVIELERKMSIREDVLRYLTVRIDALNEGPTVMMQAKNRDDAKAEARREAAEDNKSDNTEVA